MSVTHYDNALVDAIAPAVVRIQDEQDRQRDEARARREAEHAAAKATLTARGEPGQRPTLKMSLGDMLRKKL